MKGPLKIAIAGCGVRGREVYGRTALHFPNLMKIVALADSNTERLSDSAKEFCVTDEMCFSSVEEMLSVPKLADVMFICTQDKQHASHAIPALKAGYDLLLEKPVSPSLEECREVERVALETGREVCVCHVLRYTQFYQRMKQIINSGELGDIVTIQACEGVGYWHQAHSYVRGAWRNSKDSSPMILAKCCHDMDILLWLSGRKCISVSSYGSLHEFCTERAPEGSTLRCLNGCLAKENCPYDAEKIYITGEKGILKNPEGAWPVSVLTPKPTLETITDALKTGPYGRCVYHCDNNVVDHQVVNLRMDNDMTVSFTMSAFASEIDRTIRVMGTKGELYGDMEHRWIKVCPFGKKERMIEFESLVDDFTGHGGGDRRMLEDYFTFLRNRCMTGTSLTSISTSIASHYVALAAEESRLRGGANINIDEFSK